MEGQRIILNDGTTIEDGRVGYSEGFLWCYFSGYTMQQAALIFLDPSKTSKIIFQFGEMENEYTGFTECVVMRVDVDGNNSVCLQRGA